MYPMEEIVSWAKRRGFIFPSSEIYGGLAAVYDYGHYGVLLKNNIQQAWWNDMVLTRRDVVGLDSAIFMHPTTWKASGHVDSFSDPLIDCRDCKYRMRADHLLEKFGYDVDRWPIEKVNEILSELRENGKLSCEHCGKKNLTDARDFNLLVKTNFGSPVGSLKDLTDEEVVYPRGETCQGIYLEYKNIIDSMRVKLPFGIAQIGKAFRNEIVAKQFIFRTREFEQMEMQYFLSPEIMDAKFEYWKEERMKWYVQSLGMPQEKLRFKKHEKLAHYAKAAFDIEYNFGCFGKYAEVEGVHQRGDWDLSRHAQFSGANLEYVDQVNKKRFIPHIMETSVGLNRLVLMVIDNALTNETLENGKTRTVLRLKPSLAPIKAAVFPLQKDAKLQDAAEELYSHMKKHFVTEYDDAGNIGKMYRRQDEIGTPFCITVDYQTIEDGTVTVRDRDTMKQQRIQKDEVSKFILEQITNL
jgi:glycyl-tRNA synthetase